jgi:CubicO group peptidase (beta-lactamase class C family)
MQYAYHGITSSWTVGEVIRRVDGRAFSQMMRDEIGAPLGIESEMFVGIPDEAEPRVATLEMSGEPLPLPHDATPQAVPAMFHPLHEWMNRPDARRACVPASNGIMSARAIARHYAALLPGGVDGIELLPPGRIRLAIDPPWTGKARPEDPHFSHRLGYLVCGFLPGVEFGHGGYGESQGIANIDQRLAIGFTRNRFDSKTTFPRLVEIVRQELRI